MENSINNSNSNNNNNNFISSIGNDEAHVMDSKSIT